MERDFIELILWNTMTLLGFCGTSSLAIVDSLDGTRSVDEDLEGFCDEFAGISVFVGICVARKLWGLRERAGRG